MKRLNVTQGEVHAWEIYTQKGSFWRVGVSNDGESVCNITTRNMERAVGNAKLTADSINAYNKCGKLPSELLEQNRELIEALKAVREEIQHVRSEHKVTGHFERFLYQSGSFLSKLETTTPLVEPKNK